MVIIGINFFNIASLRLYHRDDLKISTIEYIKVFPNLSLLLWIRQLIECEWLASNSPPCFQLSDQI